LTSTTTSPAAHRGCRRWALPRLAYHLTADDVLSSADRIASEAGEVFVAVVALALAVDAARDRPRAKVPA
jgi:hypothetical protein